MVTAGSNRRRGGSPVQMSACVRSRMSILTDVLLTCSDVNPAHSDSHHNCNSQSSICWFATELPSSAESSKSFTQELLFQFYVSRQIKWKRSIAMIFLWNTEIRQPNVVNSAAIRHRLGFVESFQITHVISWSNKSRLIFVSSVYTFDSYAKYTK